ncbi:DUF362 domain-containing protein [bacterium]
MTDQIKPKETTSDHLSRRDFIRKTSAASAAVLMSSCGKKSSPTDSEGNNTNNGYADVSLAKLSNYEYSKLKSTVETMLDQIGGITDIVTSGDKVAMKINLTGDGAWVESQLGCPAEESIWTHSSVIRAIGEAIKDAGASTIYIVEGGGDGLVKNSNFGYQSVIASLGAQYYSLNATNPYTEFVSLPVANKFNYSEFKVNPILQEVDSYISIAKMKCHYTAGITLSMKNNIGMVPGYLYSGSAGGGTRWALHGPGGNLSLASYFLPRTIVDLNQARPIDLAVIDGISTMDKGEGSWVPNFIAPHWAQALLIGKNPVKTDAIGMQVMGFDPLTSHYLNPFVVSENWLLRAKEKGLGDPNPSKIIIAGNSPNDFPFKFHACDKNPDVMAKASTHRMTPYCGMHPDDKHRV